MNENTRCAGRNCKSTDGTNHSQECQDDHALSCGIVQQTQSNICDDKNCITHDDWYAKCNELEAANARNAQMLEVLKEISTFPRYRMPADIAKQALNSTPAQISEWLDRKCVEHVRMNWKPVSWSIGGTKLYAIPQSPEKD